MFLLFILFLELFLVIFSMGYEVCIPIQVHVVLERTGMAFWDFFNIFLTVTDTNSKESSREDFSDENCKNFGNYDYMSYIQ